MSLEAAQPPNLAEGAGTPARSCRTCRHWSQWLASTGDCLAYLVKRREALILAEDVDDFRTRWPERCARDTRADDVCDDFEAEPA